MIPLGLVFGIAVGLATRSRRRAVNATYRVWGPLGLAAAGIRLEIAGAERLALRPAVFVINHQSGIDPLLVCALLRRDFVGVAKAELRRNPLLGPALAFAGVLFIDRFDRGRALEQLAPGVALLHRGIAVALAPEGTRSPGRAPGRFKKGAFHLARAAGVPLVPIVIHGAAQVLPRGGWWMRPGRVGVDVLEPVETAGWAAADVDGAIRELEARYAERLGSAGRGEPLHLGA